MPLQNVQKVTDLTHDVGTRQTHVSFATFVNLLVHALLLSQQVTRERFVSRSLIRYIWLTKSRSKVDALV